MRIKSYKNTDSLLNTSLANAPCILLTAKTHFDDVNIFPHLKHDLWINVCSFLYEMKDRSILFNHKRNVNALKRLREYMSGEENSNVELSDK